MWGIVSAGATPTGTTRLAAVIGTPIRHSLSPTILNAAFQAAGADWVFTAFDVAEGDARAALDAMRILGLGGLSVTMPHKGTVAAAVDELSPQAELLESVNCVAWRGGQLVGHSTDGAGLVDALQVDEGWDPAGRRCVVIGAGGAARSAVVALAEAGAAEVAVVNRTHDRAVRAAALAGSIGRVGGDADVADADLVVNATPIGMHGGEVSALHPADAPAELPFDPGRIGPGQLVFDMVYHPLETATVKAARARGATGVNGVGMLIHQAAHAFRLWTGEDAPLAAMSAAALAELAVARF